MNALSVSSFAPDNLWGEALLSACHLQNKILIKKTEKTLYKLWKGYAPWKRYASKLKYLKVLGVSC